MAKNTKDEDKKELTTGEVEDSKTTNKAEKSTTEKSTAEKSTAKKPTTKKSTAKKSAAKKSAAKKSTAEKSTAEKSTAKKSAAKKSTAKKSTAEKSTAEKSTAEKSTAEKSTAKKSTAKKSTAEKSTVEKSTAEKSTAKKSTAKKSTAEKSTAEKSTAEKSTAEKSTAKKSTAKKSTAEKSTAEKSTAEKSTAKKLTTKKSTAEKSTAKKSTAEKSTAEKSTAEKSTVEKPIAEKLTTDKSTADKFTTDKSATDKSTNKNEKEKTTLTSSLVDDKHQTSHAKKSSSGKIVKALSLLVAGGLIGGFGTYFGLHNHDNSTTIAKINKSGQRLTSKELFNELSENHQIQSLASHQLTIKALGSLYPQEYKAYQKDAQQYIKEQEKQYGGEENYLNTLAMMKSSKQEVIDNYVMTNLISHSVMEHYAPSSAKLHSLYNKMDEHTYTISGVLVRNQDEANKVQDMLKHGVKYQDMKGKINKNDFAFYHNTTPTDSPRTLLYISGLSKDLANGISKMNVGETKVIHSDSAGGYFVITLKNKGKLTYKEALSELKDQYRKDLLLNSGYQPIVKSIEADYKKAGVHITDKQFSDLNDIAKMYGQQQQSSLGAQ